MGVRILRGLKTPMPRDAEYIEREREKWRAFKRRRPAQIVPPGPGQESVWDYPRPPRLEMAGRALRVEFAGIVLAHSRRVLRVIETASPPVYYVPPEDIRMGFFEASERETFCEWKGLARYWSIRVGERHADDAAWSYPRPDTGYEAIRGHLAFFSAKLDACYLDQERVTPQPKNYYGGWITADIVGPFKGEPGTQAW